jgi:CRP-like cAMP-binding protein
LKNPLILKLENLCGLDDADCSPLTFGPSRAVEINRDIVGDGSEASQTYLMLDGMACRYKAKADGKRAIIGFLIPGDFTHQMLFSRHRLDFGVAALTPCDVVDVPLSVLSRVASGNSRLAEGLQACTELDCAIQRTWLVTGRHAMAENSIAHLLCELRHRLALVGLANRDSFYLPMPQQVLADAAGLSVVHVNRVIQHLKEMRLIAIQNRQVYIPDLYRLEQFAGYDGIAMLGQDNDAAIPATNWAATKQVKRADVINPP